MRNKTTERWFDWGAEFSFSALLLALLVVGLGLDYFFRISAGGAAAMLGEASIFGLAALAILVLAASLLNLRSKLRALGKEYGKIVAQSERDTLTGILNREAFVSEAKRALDKYGKNRFFALFLVDVDHFKQVNDTHGHPAGDRVLVFVAEKLRAHFPGARVGRLGGDEFAVLFEHSDPITAKWAHEVCSKFAAGLAGKVDISARNGSVRLGIDRDCACAGPRQNLEFAGDQCRHGALCLEEKRTRLLDVVRGKHADRYPQREGAGSRIAGSDAAEASAGGVSADR
jgi:diguanylate cyclase (GGDEF)-like protein